MYFKYARLGDTFYGQPTKSPATAPISEFNIIGVTEDFVTAVRLAQSRETQTRYPNSIHVFSRHTGQSTCGWAHVSTFRRARVNFFTRKRVNIAAAWISLLTIVLLCALIPSLF